MIRSLPLRVSPEPGEALDSWLEAMAFRYDLTFGELAMGVGLGYSSRPRWMVELRPDELRTLSLTTGTELTALIGMTLKKFDGAALAVDERTARLTRAFPWGLCTRSRFCPQCLSENGGRWQLAWRLNVAFVCTTHHCLLVDACPHCRKYQRTRAPRFSRLVRPGCCASDMRPTDCKADLTAAEVVTLPGSHPAISSQRQIYDVLSERRARFGVYTQHPCTAGEFLSDLTDLAGRVLAHVKCSGMECANEQELIREYLQREPKRAGEWSFRRYQESKRPPIDSAAAAVGLSAALKILSSRSIPEAALAMRWLVPISGAGNKPAGFTTGLSAGPVLRAIHIKAFAPELGPAQQLRHRAHREVPNPRRDNIDAARVLARTIPAMMWPSWSVSLQPSGIHRSNLRLALSCATILAAVPIRPSVAVELLGGLMDDVTLNLNLKVLTKEIHWPVVAEAATRLGEHLLRQPSPIDYERRRKLDYSALLSVEDWRAVCALAGEAPGGPTTAEAARISLFAKVSGLPPEAALSHPGQRSYTLLNRVRNMPLSLTQPLRHALDGVGETFLAANEVDEPLVWEPPLSILKGLDLPNRNLDHVSIGRVRDLLDAGRSMRSISDELGTDPDIVRHALDQHPIGTDDKTGILGSSMRSPKNRANLRKALPRERLTTMLDVEGKSGFAVAREIGVNYRVLRSLAKDYGITFNYGPKKDLPPVEWIWKQYFLKHRRLSDIARELNVCPATVSGWIRRQSVNGALRT